MKVKNLIKKLKRLDKDKEIRFSKSRQSDFYYDINLIGNGKDIYYLYQD